VCVIGFVTMLVVLLMGVTGCKPVKVTLTAKVTPTGPAAQGSPVVMSGKVSPARKGGTVIIERYTGGRWIERARGPLSSNSAYAITLNPSERTTYTLRARRAATGGDAAAVSPTLTLTVAGVPSAPSAVSATAGNQSATVTWTPGPSNGSPITGYRVRVNGSVTVDCPATTCQINGLANGSPYQFTVTAHNAMGMSAPSASTAVVVPFDPSGSTVVVSKGPPVNVVGCSACHAIVVTLDGFPAGTHQVRCFGSYGGWSEFHAYATSSTSSQSCYYGYPGTQVYVIVDGQQSNTLSW
jgi:hypothetical protein